MFKIFASLITATILTSCGFIHDTKSNIPYKNTLVGFDPESTTGYPQAGNLQIKQAYPLDQNPLPIELMQYRQGVAQNYSNNSNLNIQTMALVNPYQAQPQQIPQQPPGIAPPAQLHSNQQLQQFKQDLQAKIANAPQPPQLRSAQQIQQQVQQQGQQQQLTAPTIPQNNYGYPPQNYVNPYTQYKGQQNYGQYNQYPNNYQPSVGR